MANETQEEFLKDLEVKNDVFEQPIEVPNTVETPEKEEAPDGFSPKNRRERRLLEQNQRLREETIAATARLQGITEARKFAEETQDDYIKSVRAIYGDDTPEKKAASDLLEQTLRKVEENAIKKAEEKFVEREESSTQAVRVEEDGLDEMIDVIGDEFDKDLSPEERRGFYSLLEKVSPKDEDGNIIEYADPIATYELYESRRTRSNDRAKNLASRSMTASGASQPSELKDDATWRALKDAGIF